MSLCMHAMNRTWQVKQTLRHNVMACVKHELILVDFGSTDGLDEWVRAEFAEDIKAKRLVCFRTPTPTRFHASKSKNLPHHLGSGDNPLNCDRDNFVTEGDLDRIAEVFEKEPESIVQNFTGDFLDGTYGRLALTRKNFDRLGGYDEGDLPGFSGPIISRKMAPNPRGAHEKKSIHRRTDGHGTARGRPYNDGRGGQEAQGQ